VNGGITWRYGGLEDEDFEDDGCEYRALVLGKRFNVSVRGRAKLL
jgi:hypothetical protein